MMRQRGVAKSSLWHVTAAAVLLALLLALAGCRESDIEESLGRQSARNIESTFGVVEAPLLADWTTDIGRRVVEVSARSNIPYEFRVLDTDMVNAFAAPYGHVYFTRGLMDFVDREDEIVFVMGHEVGHIVARHAMSGLKKRFWLTVLFNVWNTKKYADLKQATGIFAVFGLLRYSRKHEYEADRFGMEYSFATGYDPEGGAEFFRRLQQEQGKASSLDVFFMTHPPTDRRLDAVKQSTYLDPSNVEAMVTIGDGYAQRGQYRRAAGRYRQAIASDRRCLQAHLGLGTALKALGQYEDAAKEFRYALRLDENNRVAKRELQRLEGAAPEVMLAEAAPQAIAQARAATDTAIQAVQSAESAVKQGTAAGVENLTASRSISRQATSDLLELADIASDAEGFSADLVAEADVAMRAASEALYRMERADADAQDAVARMLDSTSRARSALKNGNGLDPWRAAALREAGRLTQHASEKLQRIPELRPDALSSVKNAQRVASNVVSKVEKVFRQGGRSVFDSVKEMTAQAQAAGEKAKGKVYKLARETGRARTEALVAQIDVLGATASPGMMDACDKMVAYYFRTQPETVRKMRREGRTYGQIALALAGRCSLGCDVPSGSGSSDALSLVETLARRGVELRDVNVFLKFLANALQEETSPGG